MITENILGIDLGGTQLRGGLVNNGRLQSISSIRINARVSADQMLGELFQFTEGILNNSIQGIGIGVPGLVHDQVVYDVVNIPAWKRIALAQLMEEKFGLPVKVNNDANCFALGEFHFGKGKDVSSMVGLTIGTGLGSGIIIEGKLYAGANGGAGEFGMMDYLDRNYEYYASGQFFQNVYGKNGEEVFIAAKAGDQHALKMYEELGKHLGRAIRAIMYALDVPLIVLGGSVRKSFPYFSDSMNTEIKKFGFSSIARLKVEVSDLANSGILGAAALFY